MSKPFEGVRILDFTRVFAGPFCSYQLALLGAEVIKVEEPGGEAGRHSLISEEWSARELSPTWMAVNTGKRSLILDLKKPAAVEIVKQLAREVDVVVENFRPGVMDRLGIGYDALSAINPKLIYAGISGFGREGPENRTASYDGKIQALSGIMSITGFEGGGPMRAGFAVCDAIAGMTGAFAISSALYQRTHTGRGQLVDVAMLDAALTFLSPFIADYTVAGYLQGPSGNQAQSRLPTADRFAVKDGYILLAVNTDKQFQNLMRAIGRADALDDPRFVDWAARKAHSDDLREIIEAAFADADAATWDARLAAADVPAAPINTLADAVAHPQLDHRDVLQRLKVAGEEITLIGSGFSLAHGGGSLDHPPAAPGEHSEQILESIGYDATAIAALKADGVI